jgi:acetyltransferase-like isoleucine patch superfamily enzyme
MINFILAKISRVITKLYHGSKYKNCYIHLSVNLNDKKLICVGDKTEIGKNCIIRTKNEMILIGKRVQINPFTVIYGDCGVTIGNNAIIAPHCVIVTGNHEYRQTSISIRD